MLEKRKYQQSNQISISLLLNVINPRRQGVEGRLAKCGLLLSEQRYKQNICRRHSTTFLCRVQQIAGYFIKALSK